MNSPLHAQPTPHTMPSCRMQLDSTTADLLESSCRKLVQATRLLDISTLACSAVCCQSYEGLHPCPLSQRPGVPKALQASFVVRR